MGKGWYCPGRVIMWLLYFTKPWALFFIVSGDSGGTLIQNPSTPRVCPFCSPVRSGSNPVIIKFPPATFMLAAQSEEAEGSHVWDSWHIATSPRSVPNRLFPPGCHPHWFLTSALSLWLFLEFSLFLEFLFFIVSRLWVAAPFFPYHPWWVSENFMVINESVFTASPETNLFRVTDQRTSYWHERNPANWPSPHRRQAPF